MGGNASRGILRGDGTRADGLFEPEAVARVTVNWNDSGGSIGASLRLDVTAHLQPGHNTFRLDPLAPPAARLGVYAWSKSPPNPRGGSPNLTRVTGEKIVPETKSNSTVEVRGGGHAGGDAGAEWHLLGAGTLRLKRLKITLLGESYWRRKFEGGMVLLNGTRRSFTVSLPHPLRRLRDEAAPRHVIEVDDAEPGFSCEGAWELRDGEAYFYGSGYRTAAKPGEMARWSFTAPSEDTYTLLACVPGPAVSGRARRAQAADAAMYSVVRPAEGPAVTLDQREGDGGWVKLFEVRLRAREECQVMLRSGGAGLTAADAIRAESAARLNDGAGIEEVVLEPLDGTVLVNR